MHTGLNRHGAVSYDEAVSEKTTTKELFFKANSVPLIRIFNSYGLRLNGHNLKIICPFKSHKGGRESTPSFRYYPNTNSFYCYGCGIGGGGCEFVATMEDVLRTRAANIIIEKFNYDIDEVEISNVPNFSEQLEIMMDFSNSVREFRHSYSDLQSFKFIEELCKVYDTMYATRKCKHEHEMNNEALRRLVSGLKEKIAEYVPSNFNW